MNLFIIITAALAVTQALPLSEIQEHWQNFKAVHAKIYETLEEEIFRKGIFAQNLRKFEEHNKKYKQGLVSYAVGVNKFTDITHEEFKQLFYTINASAASQGLPYVAPVNIRVPKSIDWRQKGAVTSVKDQGQCGSCYAFSATGALEGQLFLKKSKLVPLSEQNLVDCTLKKGNFGCQGGWPSKCFEYIQSNGGIDTEKSYPYEEKEGQCRYSEQNSAGTDSGFVSLKGGDEEELVNAVGTVGPVSVLINGDMLQHYSKGIIVQDSCDPTVVNHAVLAVGYDTDDGTDYWILKNSWGPEWGEEGYFSIIRNKNLCGIATQSTYPVV